MSIKQNVHGSLAITGEGTLTAPFQIGATYWLPSCSPRSTEEPCPVCQGAKVVTVCTSLENFTVDCEACSLGYMHPQGTVTEYHYDPHAEPFIIAEIVRVDAEGWTVKSRLGRKERFALLCETEAEALDVSKAAYLAQEDRNMQARTHKRQGAGKAAWTVRYHNDAIKKLERELAYHRSKIGKNRQNGENNENR